MTDAELHGVLEFLRAAERMKNVTRSAWTTEGKRESVAEHSWRLGLMALVLAPAFPEVNAARLMQLCLVHDLGEALRGDIPAPEQARAARDGEPPKAAQEREDLHALLTPLPGMSRETIAALWEEYEAASTPEARLAKALDKLETILQHNQGENPPSFDYRFNLDYGSRFTTFHPLIVRLRAILDQETAVRASSRS